MYKNDKIKHQKPTGGQYRFFVIFQNLLIFDRFLTYDKIMSIDPYRNFEISKIKYSMLGVCDPNFNSLGHLVFIFRPFQNRF